jgi:hypothetical protein
VSRPDFAYDFSESEALEDLIRFGIDLEEIVEAGGFTQIANSLVEVASARNRLARVGPQVAASAADALGAFVLEILESLSQEFGLSWFLVRL